MSEILNYAHAGGSYGGGTASPSSESVTRIDEMEGEFSKYSTTAVRGMCSHLHWW